MVLPTEESPRITTFRSLKKLLVNAVCEVEDVFGCLQVVTLYFCKAAG